MLYKTSLSELSKYKDLNQMFTYLRRLEQRVKLETIKGKGIEDVVIEYAEKALKYLQSVFGEPIEYITAVNRRNDLVKNLSYIGKKRIDKVLKSYYGILTWLSFLIGKAKSKEQDISKLEELRKKVLEYKNWIMLAGIYRGDPNL